MSYLIMLFLALLPVVVLMGFIFWVDRRHPEPLSMIARGVLYGVFSIVLDLIVVYAFELVCPFYDTICAIPLVGSVFQAFFDAAIPEEACKLIMLWLLLRRNKEFDENIDGVVYAVCVGMGFAGLENVAYIIQDESWALVAMMRMFLSVPMHYMCAVLMGYFYGLAHFAPARYGRYRILIFLVPMLLHGVYDSLCFLISEVDVLAIFIVLALMLLVLGMHVVCLRRIRHCRHTDEDREDLIAFTAKMSDRNDVLCFCNSRMRRRELLS